MKKIILIFSTILIATTVTVLNVTPIKNTQPVQEVAKVEEFKPLEEIKTDIAETPVITETVTLTTIDEPIIISNIDEQTYIATKYLESYNYFFKQSINVQIWFSYYFYVYPEKFTYEIIDTNIEKIKSHFVDMTQETQTELVLERAKSLVL